MAVAEAPHDGAEICTQADREPFSLFEGDRLNRLYARIGMGRFRRFSLLKRCVAAVAVTYVPLALIAWCEGEPRGRILDLVVARDGEPIEHRVVR